MLISLKIKKVIEAEIKAQKSVIKMLEAQESNYGTNVKEVVDQAKQSINYYEKVLKEAA